MVYDTFYTKGYIFYIANNVLRHFYVFIPAIRILPLAITLFVLLIFRRWLDTHAVQFAYELMGVLKEGSVGMLLCLVKLETDILDPILTEVGEHTILQVSKQSLASLPSCSHDSSSSFPPFSCAFSAIRKKHQPSRYQASTS